MSLAAIIAAIEAVPAVAAIPARVYGGRIPGGREKFPCVIVRRVGGQTETATPMSRITVDVECCADSLAAANTLYEAVRQVAKLGPPPGFMAVMQLNGPLDASAPLTESDEYEYVWASFEFAL